MKAVAGSNNSLSMFVGVYILAVVCILSSNAKPADNDELFLRTTFGESSHRDHPIRLSGKNEDDEGGEDYVDLAVVTENAEQSYHHAQSPNDKICLTKGCVKVAARVIENMDETIDPCNDFYQFACGGFQKNTFIPPDKSSVGQFSNLRDKLKEKMILMIESDPDPMEPKIFESVRNLYKSCMDTENIEENSVAELKNLLRQIGGYPVIEGNNWKEGGYNSNELALKSKSLGIEAMGPFIQIGMTVDLKNSTRRLISISESYVGIGRKNMLKGFEDKIVKAYLQKLIDVAKFLGASDEAAKKEMKDVLNLEMEIAKIQKPQEYWRNMTASYNLMTVKEVSDMYPSIQWVDLINKYFDNENITINENEEVLVPSPSFLRDIQPIIANTSARVKANAQISQIIPMGLLTEEAQKIQDKYYKVAYGIKERAPRWKKCLSVAHFGIATSAMYVKKHFSENAKAIMDEMVKNVLNEFDILVKDLDWMDEETKNKALEKAHLIHPWIGYPKELLNNTLVDEIYHGLYLSPTGFLDNILKKRIYNDKKYLAKLRDPIEKNDWKEHAHAATVNAFYSPLDNSIEFPAGILAGVFFGEDRPLYMDYGAIGFAIGHELTHGFDDQGSQFNGNGNLVDWWNPETKKKYLERTRCVIEEYGNFSINIDGEDLYFNGINTQGENIADIGGIKETYRAYQRLSATFEEPEGVLPGLPYTTNQLIWLAAADVWCSTTRPESTKQQILTGGHTLAKFRVNGPFSNLEEFSKDWNCPIGSKMNPAKKCHVW